MIVLAYRYSQEKNIIVLIEAPKEEIPRLWVRMGDGATKGKFFSLREGGGARGGAWEKWDLL